MPELWIFSFSVAGDILYSCSSVPAISILYVLFVSPTENLKHSGNKDFFKKVFSRLNLLQCLDLNFVGPPESKFTISMTSHKQKTKTYKFIVNYLFP